MTIHFLIFYKKKQIPSERLLEWVSQWQSTCLSVETTINMELGNMSDILYDKCNKKLHNLRNLNTKHKKTDIQTNKLYTCMKNVRKKYKLSYLNYG